MRQKSFTLIELLVVIAVIGLISGIILVSTKGVSSKARDVRRKSDFDALRTALALYYDKYEHYPRQPFNGNFHNFVLSTAPAPWIQDSGGEGSLTEFINPVPVDPINHNPNGPWDTHRFIYAYATDANGQMYDLVTHLENRTDSDRCEQKCWKIYSVSDFEGTNYYWCNDCGGGSICPSVPDCGGAPYIFADH